MAGDASEFAPCGITHDDQHANGAAVKLYAEQFNGDKASSFIALSWDCQNYWFRYESPCDMSHGYGEVAEMLLFCTDFGR